MRTLYEFEHDESVRLASIMRVSERDTECEQCGYPFDVGGRAYELPSGERFCSYLCALQFQR